jgi:hypothetical protein
VLLLWPLQAGIGHLAFDYPWVGVLTSLRDTTIGDIMHKAGIELVKLVKRDHLEFRNSVGNDAQGMYETKPVRVEVSLACCFVYQETDRIVRDEQAV